MVMTVVISLLPMIVINEELVFVKAITMITLMMVMISLTTLMIPLMMT